MLSVTSSIQTVCRPRRPRPAVGMIWRNAKAASGRREGGKWREEERHFKAEFGAAFFGGRTDRRTDGRGSASGREERSLLLLAVRYSSRSSVFSLSGVSSVRPPPQSSSVCQQFSTRPCDGERTEVSRNRSFHRTVIFARAGDA